jgi:hypothetical protein
LSGHKPSNGIEHLTDDELEDREPKSPSNPAAADNIDAIMRLEKQDEEATRGS